MLSPTSRLAPDPRTTRANSSATARTPEAPPRDGAGPRSPDGDLSRPAIVDLLEATTSVDLVGGKAAPLARVVAAGFRVPKGFVLTTAADGTPTDLPRWIDGLGAGPFAVRSSAVAEDSSARSYAGQLETLLHVASHDVPRAIERCRASARAARVLRYAGSPGPVAVIVQQMVAADVAGVAFSADPRTGERGVVVVEAVTGLGDRLVGGEADAESWRGTSAAIERTRALETAVLTSAQAQRVADAAQRLETLFGSPQDVEWAIAGGELFVLQSRPITALPAMPVEIKVEVPPGDWMRDDHHAILSPLGWKWFEAYPKAMARIMGRFMPIEEMRLANIGGHLYSQLVMKGGGGGGKLPPRWILWVASRVIPSLRRANRDFAEMLDRETFMDVFENWRRTGRAELAHATDALFLDDPTTLTDDQLLARIDEVLGHCHRGLEVHADLHGPGTFALGKLALFIQDELGADPNLALDLVAGSSEKTTELHRRIEEIIARHEAELAGGSFPHTWAELFDRAPGMAAELAAWLEANHLRMMHYDPKHSTLGERPDLVLSIAEAVHHSRRENVRVTAPDADAHPLIVAAREKLSADRLGEFSRLLSNARRIHGLRDENGIETVSRPAGLLRWYVRELGRRIGLSAPEHAVYLTVDEHGPALRREIPDVLQRIERRRGEESWALRHRGPRNFGKAMAGMPPTDAFPRGLATAMRIFGWLMSAETLKDEPGENEPLRGHGIGARVVTARARVVDRPEELVSLRHGEVLVCRITSPEWSVALGRVAAIVTNEGALLSHPAVIAREYGITAVVGAGPATERIRTGDTVEVDPVEGLVKVRSRGAA